MRDVAAMAVDRFPIEAGHVAMFARAIGDPNPAWFGALRDGEPVPVPPTFVQAGDQFDPTYPLRPAPGEPWFGSGRTASGGPAPWADEESTEGGSALHAEQEFVYHRPLMSGEVLSARERPGRTWRRTGRTGGELRFAETIVDFRTEAGELVVTARHVEVRTERVPGSAS